MNPIDTQNHRVVVTLLSQRSDRRREPLPSTLTRTVRLACARFLPHVVRGLLTGKALIVVGIAGWGIPVSAQRTPSKPTLPVKHGAQTDPPEMVIAADEENLTGLSLAPDGKTVAGAGNGRDIKIYNVPMGELVQVLRAEAPVAAVAYSPDGRLLASGNGNTTLRLWNAQTGFSEGAPLLFPGEPQQRALLTLQFSPDGKSLAAVTNTHVSSTLRRMAEMTVWDMTTRAVRFHVSGTDQKIEPSDRGPESTVGPHAFSSDSGLLANSSSAGIVKIWNTATGTLKQTLMAPARTYSINGLGFLPDGKRLLASGNSSCIWDIETGALLRSYFGGARGKFLLMDEGKTLVAANYYVELYDVQTNRMTEQFPEVIDGRTISLTPDGKRLAVSGEGGAIRFWNMEAGKEHGRLIGGVAGISGKARSVALSPDGRLLALGADDKVRLWDTHHASLRQFFIGSSSEINCMAFSPDGRLLIVGTNGWGAQVWETESGILLHVFAIRELPAPEKQMTSDRNNTNVVTDMVVAPDGSRLATAYYGTYMIWNLRTFAIEHTLTPAETSFGNIDISPDSLCLATTDIVWAQRPPFGLQEAQNMIRLWNLRTGKTQTTLSIPRGMGSPYNAIEPHIRYIPKSSLIVSWPINNTRVVLWNPATGSVVKQLDTGVDSLSTLAVSADGSRLAVTTEQGTISLWNVRAGKKLRQWRGHTGAVFAPAFSPDGKTLYTVSNDLSVKLWSVPDGKLRGTLRFFTDSDSRIANAWIFNTPEGYYTASIGAEALIRWRFHGQLYPAARFQKQYNRPDIVEKLLKH